MSNITITDDLLKALRVNALDAAPVAALPADYQLHSLAKYGPARESAGAIRAESLPAFVAYLYVQANDKDKPAIFFSRSGMRLLGILDWHSDDVPRWGRHKVTYSLKTTPEFNAWHHISGKASTQDDFAEFIEENLADIIEPDGLTLLETVSKFSGRKNVTFLSSRNLGNGDVGLVWKEETEAGGGPDQSLKVPSEIKLRLPIFVGCEKATTYDFKAFLRYRIAEGRLKFEVKLHRPEKAIDLALDDVHAELSSLMNSLGFSTTVFEGSVERWPDEILP